MGCDGVEGLQMVQYKVKLYVVVSAEEIISIT